MIAFRRREEAWSNALRDKMEYDWQLDGFSVCMGLCGCAKATSQYKTFRAFVNTFSWQQKNATFTSKPQIPLLHLSLTDFGNRCFKTVSCHCYTKIDFHYEWMKCSAQCSIDVPHSPLISEQLITCRILLYKASHNNDNNNKKHTSTWTNGIGYGCAILEKVCQICDLNDDQ